jgi:hypothetical protein
MAEAKAEAKDGGAEAKALEEAPVVVLTQEEIEAREHEEAQKAATALERQIEMRERIGAAFDALEVIRGVSARGEDKGEENELTPYPTCSYWPEFMNSLPPPTIPFTDARAEYPLILERRFQYNFENGQIKATFETRPEARIKINVFRSGIVPEERVYWGKDLQYEANTRKGDDKEVADFDVRTLCNDAYREMKTSAYEEISEKMKYTAGEGIYRAQRAFLANLPDDVVSWDDDVANGSLPPLLAAASPEQSMDYPYNFGVRARRLDSHPDSVLYFYCLASDKCRQRRFSICHNCAPRPPQQAKSLYKGTNLQPPPRPLQSLRKVVELHLQEDHWNSLLQTGWAPSLQKSGPLGATQRDNEYQALPVKDFRVVDVEDKAEEK